jgi:hypothetical protein
MQKHENYYILNLLGYGLSKFDNGFIKEFGFTTKNDFFDYFVKIKLVRTASVIKNRMDLFDPFFLNSRKGWWQKGDTYIHRKHLIDSLFGNENVKEYSNIVKLYLKENNLIQDFSVQIKPIIKSKFKKLQETGLEAELFFINNFKLIDYFQDGFLEDARLYGDGYDFQISNNINQYLVEVKGIREKQGKFRLTEKEFLTATEYKNNYFITIVLNMNATPKLITIKNPINSLEFERYEYQSKPNIQFILKNNIC